MVVLNLTVLTCAYANLDMIITFSCSNYNYYFWYLYNKRAYFSNPTVWHRFDFASRSNSKLQHISYCIFSIINPMMQRVELLTLWWHWTDRICKLCVWRWKLEWRSLPCCTDQSDLGSLCPASSSAPSRVNMLNCPSRQSKKRLVINWKRKWSNTCCSYNARQINVMV